MKEFYPLGLHVAVCLSDFNNICQNFAIYDKMSYVAWDDMYVFFCRMRFGTP